MSYQIEEMQRMERYCQGHRDDPGRIRRKQSLNFQMGLEIARRMIGGSNNKHLSVEEVARNERDKYL